MVLAIVIATVTVMVERIAIAIVVVMVAALFMSRESLALEDRDYECPQVRDPLPRGFFLERILPSWGEIVNFYKAFRPKSSTPRRSRAILILVRTYAELP